MDYSIRIQGSVTLTSTSTITGTVLCGSSASQEIGIEDVLVTKESNQISKFTFTTENTSSMRDILGTAPSVDVSLIKNAGVEFKGRVDTDKITYTQTKINVTGYGYYVDLHFEFFSKDQSQYDIRRVQFDNTQADTILGYVLAGTTYTVAECPSTLISIRGEYETKLQWISAIAKASKYISGGKTYSCDWWIDDVDAVHIAQTRGSAKGTINVLEDTIREVDYGNIQNTAHGRGYGDGINQLKSSQTNSASITSYGAREVSKIDRRFQNQTSLDEEMQEHADAHADPVENINCTITTWEWYDTGLDIGDTVTIVDDTTGINGSYRIKRAEIGVVTTRLDVTNIIPRLSSEFQDIKRQLHVDGGYMQGQTVPLNFSTMDNVQSSYPLKMNMHIPDKTITINACYISFDLEAFRAFSATTTGESAHTHEVTIAAHTHPLNMWNYSDSFDTYLVGMEDRGGGGKVMAEAVGGPSAATSESGGSSTPTSAAGSEHTHTPEYGIMEDGDNSPSISIEINSVDRTSALGGPWTTDKEEIDITAYIQSTGKHTIELLSTQRTRIQADVWAQVFIQST